MKIVLNASRELDRQIAKMCGIVILDGEYETYFLIGDITDPTLHGEYFYCLRERTIVDLSQVELDLRLAIGTPIRFVEGVDLVDAIVEGVDLDTDNQKQVTLMDSDEATWIATEQITLSADWLRENGIKILEESND